MKKNLKRPLSNNSGFIVADFLFSFVLVIGIGILIFAFTFSLASIEISQYIVWSTARYYSGGNVDKSLAAENAKAKFKNLGARFPLITGIGANQSPWLELSEDSLIISDDLALDDTTLGLSNDDRLNDNRQPWTGASAKLKLKLLSGLKIPFLGNVVSDKSKFEFPVRAFIIRNVSQAECKDFFLRGRFTEGIQKLEGSKLSAPDTVTVAEPSPDANIGYYGEDNGC